MVRWVMVFGALTVSAAAQYLPPTETVALAPKQVTAVKQVVARNLKDPESARFDRPFRAARSQVDQVVMVCGLVNARNSYGGYTGNSYFIGVFPAGGGPFVLNRIATGQSDYAEAREVCGAVGIAVD